MKKIILSSIALLAFPVMALVAGPVEITGTVKSFDENLIKIENNDTSFEVPREFVPEKNLKVESKIEFLLSLEQIEKVKIQKKKSK